jgi:hypothetical protein
MVGSRYLTAQVTRASFYPEGTVILTQLGVIDNLSAALEH